MNNMMRKNNNRGGNKHRGGQRRYNNNGGSGNRNQNEGQNLQRQKHHATQQLGKYNDLARNAQINGDRVDVEYYLQHVDHYTRVLSDIAAIEAERFAHQRDQQAQHAPVEGQGDGSEGGEITDAQSAAEGAEQRQPRPQQHRRQHYSAPLADSAVDNGAKEANANTTEIPLPGNILPPI